jgi:hypothetical protein
MEVTNKAVHAGSSSAGLAVTGSDLDDQLDPLSKEGLRTTSRLGGGLES